MASATSLLATTREDLGGLTQTGSHDLSHTSTEGEEFTGFGDLVSGIRAQATSNNDTVLSGFIDLASAPNAVVLGGTYATASGYQADVIGGFEKLGDWEQFSGRGGGYENKAAGNDSAILGGKLQEVTAEYGHTP